MDMYFTKSVYEEIVNSVGSLPSETGGILLGSRDDYIVRKFVFDDQGSNSHAGYDPNVDFLNKIIKKEWEENELALLGFIHSHPRGVSRLSGDWGGNTGDIGYIKAIFSAIPALNKFLVPIMYSSHDGAAQELFPYVAERGNEENYQKYNLVVVDEDEIIEQEESSKKKASKKKPKLSNKRLLGSVDSDLLSSSHICIVGVGGASGLCEDLVRSGVAEITILDFDTVDQTNIATQGYYVDEIGKLKIEALGARLKKINPDLVLNSIEANFLELSENKISNIIDDVDLLMMMTDDFQAQKRGNLVSLKYKIPAIFAIMYELARGAEITFNIPGVTPGCHRCATSYRYKQYDDGYTNEISSQGSNSFQTHYFNSVIGLIALSILHRNIEGIELGNWFGKRWDRNLVQLRLHPKYMDGKSMLFNQLPSNRTYCFDSIWQKIEEESPPKYKSCPDCGGNGDLNKTKIDYSI